MNPIVSLYCPVENDELDRLRAVLANNSERRRPAAATIIRTAVYVGLAESGRNVTENQCDSSAFFYENRAVPVYMRGVKVDTFSQPPERCGGCCASYRDSDLRWMLNH
jgi:hypothetical protein